MSEELHGGGCRKDKSAETVNRASVLFLLLHLSAHQNVCALIFIFFLDIGFGGFMHITR